MDVKFMTGMTCDLDFIVSLASRRKITSPLAAARNGWKCDWMRFTYYDNE